MKKVFVIIIIGFLFPSCTSDDDGIDCEIFDPAFPSLFIRIVDATGANLIENENIDPNNITVEGDFPNAGFQFIPASVFPVSCGHGTTGCIPAAPRATGFPVTQLTEP